MTLITSRTIQAAGLVLRPPASPDAQPIQTLCTWDVVRMTSRMPHPYTIEDARGWIARREDHWADGTEYTFAITRDDVFVGVIGIDLKGGQHEIGYWVGEPWWGRGIATAAVDRIIRFGFAELGLDRLAAGHYNDNPASGRVLAKNGFRYIGETMLHSVARGGEARSLLMELTRADFTLADGRTGQ